MAFLYFLKHPWYLCTFWNTHDSYVLLYTPCISVLFEAPCISVFLETTCIFVLLETPCIYLLLEKPMVFSYVYRRSHFHIFREPLYFRNFWYPVFAYFKRQPWYLCTFWDPVFFSLEPGSGIRRKMKPVTQGRERWVKLTSHLSQMWRNLHILTEPFVIGWQHSIKPILSLFQAHKEVYRYIIIIRRYIGILLGGI